jgi:apolipoprotein N-acyltransferase
VLRAGSPHETDSVFGLIALVFLFLFIAGIAADCLETRFREVATAVMAGLLAANAIWNLVGMAKIRL